MSLKTSPRVKKDDFKHENDQNEGAKMDENYLLKRKIIWPENSMKPKP